MIIIRVMFMKNGRWSLQLILFQQQAIALTMIVTGPAKEVNINPILSKTYRGIGGEGGDQEDPGEELVEERDQVRFV